jgi:hypothetical protein
MAAGGCRNEIVSYAQDGWCCQQDWLADLRISTLRASLVRLYNQRQTYPAAPEPWAAPPRGSSTMWAGRWALACRRLTTHNWVSACFAVGADGSWRRPPNGEAPALRQRDPGHRGVRGTAGPTSVGRDRRGRRSREVDDSGGLDIVDVARTGQPRATSAVSRGCSARPSPGRSAGPARPVPRRPG